MNYLNDLVLINDIDFETKMADGGVADRTALSEEEKQFIREESQNSGQGFTYRAKVLHGEYVVLKEKNGSPLQKWSVDNFDIAKKIADRLNNTKISKGGSSKQWIQKATKSMEKKGTVGLFTKKAKLKGLTPVEYAKDVLAHPKKHTLKTREEAQFVKNANKELF